MPKIMKYTASGWVTANTKHHNGFEWLPSWFGPKTKLMQPDWTHIVDVGPNHTLKTLQDGLNAARQKPFAAPGYAPEASYMNLRARGGRPYYARTVVRLWPGTYSITASSDIGDGVDVIGMGNTHKDVTIYTSGAINYNIRTFGSLYLANLTVHHDEGATGNNYCFHGSHSGGTRDFTTVFDNVHFKDTNSTSTGIVGWDMPPGTQAILYRCDLTTTRAITGDRVVFHDMPGTSHLHVSFVECTIDVPDEMNIGYSYTTNTGVAVNLRCKNSDGTPIPDRKQVNHHTAPWEPATEADVVYPEKCIRPVEVDKYVPKTVAGSRIARADAAVASPTTAQRIYYVPLTTLAEAFFVANSSLNVSVAAGQVRFGLYISHQDDLSKPWSPINWKNLSTAVVGEMTQASHAPFEEVFLERPWRVWSGVMVTDATIQLPCITAALDECWYEDVAVGTAPPLFPSATLTRVPAGALAPVASMVAK